MGPAQLCTQCVHNLQLGENLGKPDHIEEVPPSEALTEFANQLSRQCGDNFLSVLSPFIPKHFRLDALSDPPVEQRHPGIDRAGDALAALLDHAPHVGGEAGRTLNEGDLCVVHGSTWGNEGGWPRRPAWYASITIFAFGAGDQSFRAGDVRVPLHFRSESTGKSVPGFFLKRWRAGRTLFGLGTDGAVPSTRTSHPLPAALRLHHFTTPSLHHSRPRLPPPSSIAQRAPSVVRHSRGSHAC